MLPTVPEALAATSNRDISEQESEADSSIEYNNSIIFNGELDVSLVRSLEVEPPHNGPLY